MNMRVLRWVGLCLLVASALLHADDMNAAEYTNKFYKEWSAPRERGDDGAAYTMARFYHEVPPALQAQVLDQILDRAASAQPKAYGVMGYVFMCLRNFGTKLTLPSGMDANLQALAKDSNWMARRDVLQVARALNRTKDHDLIVAALNDPQDEVRGAAIDALRERPDAEATFQKFIQDHQADPAYRTSVLYAKSGLDAIHEKGHSQ
jgi:hypothetical protein